MRLQTISFFLAVLLAAAAVVQFLWNRLRRDFTGLPRLNYGMAAGLVALWGLLFVVVLGMVAGARELMTPGAWERQANGGYKLVPKDPPSAAADHARHAHLDNLRDAL